MYKLECLEKICNNSEDVSETKNINMKCEKNECI